MTTLQVNPSFLSGTIAIPPSKSHTLRAILFAMMGKGKSRIYNPLHSTDTAAMLCAITQFGAKISFSKEVIEINGLGGHLLPAENVIEAGSSGIVLRFIGAIAGLLPTYTIITGDHSIRHNRIVEPLLQGLRQFGAFAASARLDQGAPIIIKGPMQPQHVALSGEDSQPVSALLIAASFLQGASSLSIASPGEKPWIDLTLDWLQYLGIRFEHQDYTNYTLYGCADYAGFEKIIPGDWSSAAYPIAAALLTQSELTIENVDICDVQGDKKFISVLQQMGANIETDSRSKTAIIKKSPHLKGIKIDINSMIDMISILPVIACFAEGQTEIFNGAIARKKESDRIRAITIELRKMGAKIEEREDGMVISHSPLSGAHLECHADHRIALSLIVAAMAAKGSSLIANTSCIEKTYPSFCTDVQQLGAKILWAATP